MCFHPALKPNRKTTETQLVAILDRPKPDRLLVEWWTRLANQAHKEWLLVRVSMTPLAKVAGQSKLVATAATIFIASKNSRRNRVPSTFPFGRIQWLPA